MDDFPPIDDQLEEAGSVPAGPGLPWGVILATVGIVLLVVFAVQNTETVPVEFLWFNGDYPLSIVILVTAVAAGILSVVSAAIIRRRRRRRALEKHELRQLRDQT